MVCITYGRFDDVCIIEDKKNHRCKRKPHFMVFVDDGLPRPSRLESYPCKLHLLLAIERALEADSKIGVE